MRIKSQKDFFAGLIFASAGVAFAWEASGHVINHAIISQVVDDNASMGPGWLPLLLGGVLAVIGALLTFRSLVVETADGHPVGKLDWRALGCIAVAVILFGVLLGGLPGFGVPPLGLVTAIYALVMVSSLASDKFCWKEALILSTILSAASWAALVWWLKLPLQTWPRFIAG